MRIPQIKFLSPLDKAINLLKIIESSAKKPVAPSPYDRKVEVLGSEYTVREIRSMYKQGLKMLSHDKFDKEKI